MKKFLVIGLIGLMGLVGFVEAQAQDDKSGKRERKKNLVVKEWNQRTGSSTPYLDHITTYDELGRKVEEIEYASYGQKKRTVYEYVGTDTKCSREIEYNYKNHATRIKKFEYNADGTKAKQYNYRPDGKLESVKTFEYSYK
jgi:hypothetical protein